MRVSECFVLLFLAGVGCSRASDERSGLTIVGGRMVPPAAGTAMRQSTFALTSADLIAEGHSYCSATLVAPQILLTAAHCIVDDQFRSFAEEAIAMSGPLVDHNSPRTKVVQAFFHESYDPKNLDTADDHAMNDLGLLKLEVPSAIGAVVPIGGPGELSAGESLVLAGYGVTRSRSRDNTGRLRQVNTNITKVSAGGRVFFAMGKSKDSNDGAISGGACAGDSGGPAYRRIPGGKWQLVGITSFGIEQARKRGIGSYCIGLNGFVDLSRYTVTLMTAIATLSRGQSQELQGWREAR